MYTSISELKEREGVSREKNLGLEVQVFEKKVERKRFYSSLLFFFFLFFFLILSSSRISDVVICRMSCDFLS